ncbi:hypothetical protein GCM10010289_09370 [Streptomyces violascens]|uniref:Uncharacterized protein n=1 Tax=Streptomyces violascens TaxID=67381 RepID=A0ABQ3QH70_9ACTN|nr:hypothetical protein GCM10010289_09370 [Streptomyces violascens]GHI36602.1 hypothetical protein Sviol_10100 [Streptomyces violascens]
MQLGTEVRDGFAGGVEQPVTEETHLSYGAGTAGNGAVAHGRKSTFRGVEAIPDGGAVRAADRISIG